MKAMRALSLPIRSVLATICSKPEKSLSTSAGAQPIPALPGLDQVSFFTNSTMMDVDFVPEHLIIVGGSYIGLEFAQMYRRFGSEVTIVEMAPRLIQREDADVSQAIGAILEAEGVHMRLNAKCIALEKRGEKVAVNVDCSAGDKTVVGSHVLIATGRKPNTDDLGLQSTGVALDQRGYIQVDDQLRTNVPDIYALGDCNGRGAFTHTAYNDYEIVAANLLDGDPRRVSDRITAYALFIDPPLGRAGMTEAEVRKSGRKALIGNAPDDPRGPRVGERRDPGIHENSRRRRDQSDPGSFAFGDRVR